MVSPSCGHSILPQEYRWLNRFAAVLLLLTTLPYLIGFAMQGDGWRFTGFVFGVEDGNSYLAKMLSGMSGAWLFRTPYTALPQQGVLMYLPYILLGKLASQPGAHVQLVALYHLFRIAGGWLMIRASYQFIAYFVEPVSLRRLGIGLAVAGGGLGWLLILLGAQQWLGSLPLDLYSPETFGFLSIYGLPHLAVARALLLWALLAYLRGAGHAFNGSWSRGDWLNLTIPWSLAGFFQPLAPILIGAVIALHLIAASIWLNRQKKGDHEVWKAWRQSFLTVIGAGVIPGLFALYNTWSLWKDPFLQAWTAQNIIRSPHPFHYLAAYGLFLTFALVGARRLYRNLPWESLLPITWVLALPLLAYAPLNLQRRLPEGIWTAIVVLAMAAISQQSSLRPYRLKPQWILAILAFPTTLLLWLGGVQAALRPAEPVFRPADQVQAFQALGDVALPGEVILCAYETGNALPAWAPVRVVVGHGPESAGKAELMPRVADFFSDMNDEQRSIFLQEQDVRYVLWGPAERALGAWSPEESSFLEQIYEKNGISIFRVAWDHSAE